jgi:mutator protein MutT
MKEKILVYAAVIREDGKVLITTRPPDKSMAGFWEFPGGKIKTGENPGTCLKREIREELGIDVIPIDTIYIVDHEYPDKRVEVRFVRCLRADASEPSGLEGQQVCWCELGDLENVNLLEADIRPAYFLSIQK